MVFQCFPGVFHIFVNFSHVFFMLFPQAKWQMRLRLLTCAERRFVSTWVLKVSPSVLGSGEAHLVMIIPVDTSSTAQGDGGSFKNRKPIGAVGRCQGWQSEATDGPKGG